MTDPFRALHRPDQPVDPDARFAADLRSRLARALNAPQGVIVSTTSTGPHVDASRAAQPVPRHGDVGYASLQVPDAEMAATFFGEVLGWEVTGGDGRYQVEGQTLHHGIYGTPGEPTLFLAFAVADVDAAADRVRAAGGQASGPTDEPYGRLLDCVDDQGVAFALYTPPGGVSAVEPPLNGARHGDISYVTLHVVDSAKTREFYGAVLGWDFRAGRIDDGWEPNGVAPMLGLSGGHDVARGVPMYRVNDIHEAVARVRAAGGTATDAETVPYGMTSTCTDDQGTQFYLGQH